jgi:hypothetical protein
MVLKTRIRWCERPVPCTAETGSRSASVQKTGSSRIWLQRCVTPCKGEMTRDAVEWCQGTSAGGGCFTRAWTRRQRQRDGSAAGGHPRFWGDTYPAILVPAPASTACRKRTGAGPHEAPMRDLAKPGPARRPGAFAQVSREGTVRGIAHRVKPEWSVLPPFPASPETGCAPRNGRRVWTRRRAW